MKKGLCKLMAVVTACVLLVSMLPLSMITASAESWGFSYTISNGKAAITDYYGTDTDVVIPARLGGYPVSYIADYAFNGNQYIKSVTIPDNGILIDIGIHAFSNCSALTKVNMPSLIGNIGQEAFYNCKALKTLTVPYVVGHNPYGTFMACSSLKGVTIADGNKAITESMFANCRSLNSVIIPASMIVIGPYAFYGTALKNVYYTGTEAQWEKINISSHNTALTSAKIHYNCDPVTVQITEESATVAYAEKGKTASAKVAAVGDGRTYTWYVKNPGATKYSKSSVTSSTYTTKMTEANSGRLVYCVVKDRYGNEVRSKAFLLRMKATITSVPSANACAKIDNKVSVKIGAAGEGLTYTWYVKNKNATKYSKSSVKGATYSTTLNSTSEGRHVYCVVKDKYGKTAKTKTFVLREAVSIVTQPQSVYGEKGAKVSTTVEVRGDGLTYTWYIKNAGQTKYAKSSAVGPTYTTKMTDASKDRLLSCLVVDQYGNEVRAKTVQLKMK